MNWSVCYWRKPDVVVIDSSMCRFEDAPRDMVLWLQVERDGYRHRLKGGDVYWVSPTGFGMVHHHSYRRGFWLRRRYEHVLWRLRGEPFEQVAWWWNPEGGTVRTRQSPPDGAVTFTGGLAPNDVARREGLL